MSNPFRSDWSGLRSKLDRELTPDRLQSRLKGMTAGDEIVVRHGRTTVRVRAVLRDRMDHLGSSGTTEFNTGTDVQRTFVDVDATGQGHHGLLGITGSAPIPGAPVSMAPGLTGTGGRGREQIEVHNSSVSSGMATKAKLPGSAYQGAAELQFTFERRPLIGASVFQRRTAVVGFESIVETAGTVPVPEKAAAKGADEKAAAKGADEKAAAKGADEKDTAPEKEPVKTIPQQAVEPASIPIPPERVWKSGLRDTDVLRFLVDVGGVQDLVRLRGPEYFGRSAWEKMESQRGGGTKYASLSALFASASHGTPESEGASKEGAVKEGTSSEGALTEETSKESAPKEGTPKEGAPKEGTSKEGAKTAPIERVLFGRDKGVEFNVRLVSLEHRNSDVVGELSPANSASGGSLGYALSAGDAGAQAQLGAKITGTSSFTNTPAIIGGSQHAWRAGGGHGGAGQIVSNGKIPGGAALYHGYAEVEVTFFDGNREQVKEKGLIPVALDIPLSETRAVDVPEDHYLSFGPAHRAGELQYGEPGLLNTVHRARGGDQPYDQAKATPADHQSLVDTVRLGRAVYGEDFAAGTGADRGRIQAVHHLVMLGGGTYSGTADLLGDLLGTPKGDPLPVDAVVQVADYFERRATEAARPLGAPGRTAGDGPFTLEDLVLGAHDGWPAQEQYDVHRETWTDRGPASGLVTSAMATAADAARALPGDGTPAGGQLSLTVLGQDASLLLSQRFQLDGGDVAEQIRKFEEKTYLKPGTPPSEVIVQLTPSPGANGDWDYLVAVRPGGERELTLRHRKPAGAQPQDGQPQDAPSGGAPLDDAAAARVAAAWRFAAGRDGSPEASG
ncbi:hypothetical protein ACFQ2M_32935 [Kitasatospora saccharophila]|uniref:hypothetical protein n=1 Tax=Kitasatospora saccharophila TaxID=407973 RepID=UPI003635436C